MASYRRLHECVAYLESLAAQAVSSGNRRLAATRAICRASGFSRRTIGRALSMLVQKGSCVVVPGGGIFAGRPEPRPVTAAAAVTDRAPAAAAVPSWQRLKWAISEELLAGTYPPGTTLPSCKQLSAQHGVSHTTLLRALGSLVADGRLRRTGKRHERASPASPRTASTIVFIAHGDALSDMIAFTPRSAEYLRQLEKVCNRHGLRLVFLSFWDAVQWTTRARAMFSGGSSRPLVGVLVWTLGLNADDLRKLTASLSSVNLPVALFDEGGNAPLPHQMVTHPLMRVFVTGYTPRCGLDVGTYLLNRGHTAAAFFSVTADGHAFRNRAAGVEERLRGASPGALLRRVVLEEGKTRAGLRELLKENPAYREALRITQTRHVAPHELGQAVRSMQTEFIEFARRRFRTAVLSALSLRGVTVWVAENDQLAFVLLDVLRSRGVRVPERVSVVGFDDVPDAFGVGLTTYNYNVSAYVDAMVDYILGGLSSRHLRSHGLIEVPGYVVERSSCGPVPSATGH